MPRPVNDTVRQQRRSQILDVVEKIIAQEGLGALTMQRIIRGAGQSAGSVYHQFDGKDQILAALIDRQDEGTQEMVDALASGYPVRDVLEHSAAELLAYLCDRETARLNIELAIGARGEAPWAEALREQNARLASALTNAIRSDVDARKLPRRVVPEAAASLILAIWDGLVSQAYDGQIGAPEDVKRHYLAAIRGVLKP